MKNAILSSNLQDKVDFFIFFSALNTVKRMQKKRFQRLFNVSSLFVSKAAIKMPRCLLIIFVIAISQFVVKAEYHYLALHMQLHTHRMVMLSGVLNVLITKVNPN